MLPIMIIITHIKLLQDEGARESMPQTFFIARQPIFDQNENLWGFELLFRNGLSANYAEIDDPESASVAVASSGFLQATTGGASSLKIFINFTQSLIFDRFPLALPSSTAVVEILEDIPVSDELIERLKELKERGYILALDDFAGEEKYRPLFSFIDIIKLDCYGKAIKDILEIKRKFSNVPCVFLAEKVESEEVFSALRSNGFMLFQGYYFAKPQILSGNKISSAVASRLNLAAEIEKKDLDTEAILKAIQIDASLTYRLLRYINSSAFSFREKIVSVRQAITLLGFEQLRHWLRLILYSDVLGGHSNPEMLRMALQRALFLDKLGSVVAVDGNQKESLFLVGMFSLLEVILKTPMAIILKDLPLSENLKSALLKEEGEYANYLYLSEAIEKFDFEKAENYSDILNISGEVVLEAFQDASEMSDYLMNQASLV